MVAIACGLTCPAVAMAESAVPAAPSRPSSDADAEANPEHASGGAEHERDHVIADALVVNPGATCLEHDRLSEQIAGWLEHDELDPRLSVVVEGDQEDAKTVRFTLRDEGAVLSERVFSPGPSRCDDLHAVVALAIAMAVDATVLASAGIVEPKPPLDPLPETPVPKADPEVTPDAPKVAAVPVQPLDLGPPPARWALRAVIDGTLAIRLPPDVGGGGYAGLELGWNDLVDVSAGAMATGNRDRPLDGTKLAVALVAARADLCVGPWAGRVRPRGCFGAIGGAALARGEGFEDENFRTVVPWFAVALGAGIRVPLARRIRLSLRLEGVATVVRPVFNTLEEFDVRTLRRLPWVGALASVGLAFDLLVFRRLEGRGGPRP